MIARVQMTLIIKKRTSSDPEKAITIENSNIFEICQFFSIYSNLTKSTEDILPRQ